MVAHVERNPEDVAVTYNDFNNAIDHLGEMFRRYLLLIDQGGLLSATRRFRGTGRAVPEAARVATTAYTVRAVAGTQWVRGADVLRLLVMHHTCTRRKAYAVIHGHSRPLGTGH